MIYLKEPWEELEEDLADDKWEQKFNEDVYKEPPTDEEMLLTSSAKYEDCVERMKKGWIEDDRATTWENKKFRKLVDSYCTVAHFEKHATTQIKLEKM